jgi:hypothetical protein
MKNLQNSVKEGVQLGFGAGLWGVGNRPHRPKKPRRRSLQAATQNCIMVRRTILVPGLHPEMAPKWAFSGVFSGPVTLYLLCLPYLRI